MSVTIRLFTVGKKHQKSYRVVVATTRSRRQGKPIEIIGSYNPLPNPPLIKIDEKRLEYWKNQGALITGAVQKLISKRSS